MQKKTTHKLFLLLSFLLLVVQTQLSAQQNSIDIYSLMERTDLTLNEIEKIAKEYFDQAGRGKGSGNTHYERWLYEQKFHLNENGTFRSKDEEQNAYDKAIINLRNNDKKTRAAWTDLGPITQNVTSSWNPGHGRCWTVAVNPADNNIIYAGTDGGGIWKTINGGTSWSPLMDFTNSAWQEFYFICIDPNVPTTVYAGLKNGGIIKSTNSGSTWSATGSGPNFVKRIRVYPGNSNIVFATGSGGIYRSTNGGTTWGLVKGGSTEDLQFNPSNSNTMYASTSTSSTFWRSSDSGKTWTNITSGITNSGRSLIGVSANNSNIVYIAQANGSLFGRIYKSTDGGLTFTTTVIGGAASGTNYFGYSTTGSDSKGQATHDMAFVVNPSNVNELHLAGIICWKSTNGGTSFTATTDWTWGNTLGYNHADVHSLAFVGNKLFSSSDGGIWKSTNNAADWVDISSNMGTRQFYKIACAKTNANVIAGGAQDNGSTFRTSTSVWREWLGADGMDAAISSTTSSTGIGTSQYGDIYLTTNSGSSRTNLVRPAAGNWVTPIEWHPTSGTTVFGGWNGVYKSTNTGSTWTKISGTTISSNVNCLQIAPSNANYIYASVGSTIYRTWNGGTNWSSASAGGTITSICVSPLNPTKIWVTTSSSSNNVKVSTDTGKTFTNISAGLPLIAARSVAVENNADENLYVGMNIGVYFRNNQNTTWVEQATGLPLVAVNEVAVQQSGGKLRVGTYGRGIWESPLKSIAPKSPIQLNTYCVTNAKSNNEWIESVAICDVLNESGNDKGYHKHEDAIAMMSINNTYPLTVQAGFENTQFQEFWSVFIDYNHDGDFNDENELVSEFITNDAEKVTKNIAISTSAKIGYTTMRVVMNFNHFADGCNAENGEVEDYTIHIGSMPTGFEVISNEATGLKELSSEATIYPNPAQEIFIVTYQNQQESVIGKIIIADINGKVVYNQEVTFQKGTNKFRIQTSNLNTGSYIVRVGPSNQQTNLSLQVTK